MSSLGEGEVVTETSNNNTSDISGLSRLQEKEEMMKAQVTSPPTVSPTISQPRVKSRATPSGGSTKSLTNIPNISPKSLLPGDVSRPQSTSSRSSCEYQQSPGSGPGEFVSPEYRRGSGYFRSYNGQQAGYYAQYQAQAYNQTSPGYRQNMQAGGEQYGGQYGAHYNPSYPGYEGGQEMAGYYNHHAHPHTANNTNYTKQGYGHYPAYSEGKAGYYYPGAACQGGDNTPLPPDFTYVGSSASNEASSGQGYQDFYAC